MIIKSAELETVCGITSKLPDNIRPEFAFAGRSNVGKSSLINKLVNRKALARTSSQPGKTQTINFFLLNKEFYFVDLPGYGYAKVSKEVSAKWGKMIERYLVTSKQLKVIFLLVDIRHEPSAGDRQMHEWVVANGFRPVVIVTKADKINRSQVAKQLAMIRKELKMKPDERIIPWSKETAQGFDEVWKVMEEELYGPEPETDELKETE
ncbi:MAG: YihA family ribosome biogenesis GTP-binding protein [Lachnospiraceae bacterium]|nr:YihA family ribosome biogenesis GTP-binding protein [Lachnospiraceae bacterium]